MSSINGDKARFHRKRTDKIARGSWNRERPRSVTVQYKPKLRASKEKGVPA